MYKALWSACVKINVIALCVVKYSHKEIIMEVECEQEQKKHITYA